MLPVRFCILHNGNKILNTRPDFAGNAFVYSIPMLRQVKTQNLVIIRQRILGYDLNRCIYLIRSISMNGNNDFFGFAAPYDSWYMTYSDSCFLHDEYICHVWTKVWLNFQSDKIWRFYLCAGCVPNCFLKHSKDLSFFYTRRIM